jgi:uncharacterized membrane protein
MDQEIIRPQATPPASSQSIGIIGCLMSAIGVTLMTITMLGSALAAAIWAFSQLFGLPDSLMQVIMALGAIPVVVAAIWTAGRAWHIERRLEEGHDVDPPVFSLTYYLKRAPGR